MSKPKPFGDIESTLLNDAADSSAIELDGVSLVSGNDWVEYNPGECPMQEEIHDTIRRVEQILADYRDGKLVYVQ